MQSLWNSLHWDSGLVLQSICFCVYVSKLREMSSVDVHQPPSLIIHTYINRDI